MNNLKQAQLDKALSAVFRYDTGVMTRRQWLDRYAVDFISKEEPKYEYNRLKFNAMNAEQQAAYEQRMQQRTVNYYAVAADQSLISIPKIVYEFYKENKQS